MSVDRTKNFSSFRYEPSFPKQNSILSTWTDMDLPMKRSPYKEIVRYEINIFFSTTILTIQTHTLCNTIHQDQVEEDIHSENASKFWFTDVTLRYPPKHELSSSEQKNTLFCSKIGKTIQIWTCNMMKILSKKAQLTNRDQ